MTIFATACDSTNEATYSPEDNKIRLYCGRVDRDVYLALRKEGFKSTPKQDSDFVAVWTPRREDIALEMLTDGKGLEEEESTLAERAEDRADRFAGYRDKRRAEAHGHAGTYESGESVVGHQSQAKAEKAAARRDRTGKRAVAQWEKAEYWQWRTQAVISHALFKMDAGTRRGRILTLEKEQRQVEGRTDEYGKRWHQHLTNRLSYERAMLENEGGSLDTVEMKVGGFIGKYQIFKINKSRVTGRVVSIAVEDGGRAVNIQRLGNDGSYRDPTEEELAKFKADLKAARKAKNAAKPKKPSLINPTLEDAQRLQDAMNKRAFESAKANGREMPELLEIKVVEMTSKAYQARSKGSYAHFGTVYIVETLQVFRQNYRNDTNGTPMFKVRSGSTSGFCMYAPRRIVVINDKPQKSLPFEACQEVINSRPSPKAVVEYLAPRVQELQRNQKFAEGLDPEMVHQGKIQGLYYQSSATQFGLTNKGNDLAKVLGIFEEKKIHAI